MNWFKKLFSTRFKLYATYNEVQWSKDDAIMLKNFINSNTGAKLMLIMLNDEAHANAQCAEMGIKDREFKSGSAYGIKSSRNGLLGLAKTNESTGNATQVTLDDQTISDDDYNTVLDNLIKNRMRDPVLG